MIEKIYSAMRSLYRFSIMKDGIFPELVIENEKNILKNRFNELQAEDILYIVNNWEHFLKKECVDQEINDQIFFNNLKKELSKLN